MLPTASMPTANPVYASGMYRGGRCECHLWADFFDHIQVTLFAAALCSTCAPVNGVESTGISVGSPLSQFA